jgi:hypothetical protein
MTQVEHFDLQQVERLIGDISVVSSCSKEAPRVGAYLRSAVGDEDHIDFDLQYWIWRWRNDERSTCLAQ